MRLLLFFFALIILHSPISAQVYAITDSGDEVLLYNDGTWKYVNDSLYINTETPFNDQPFFKYHFHSRKDTIRVI